MFWLILVSQCPRLLLCYDFIGFGWFNKHCRIYSQKMGVHFDWSHQNLVDGWGSRDHLRMSGKRKRLDPCLEPAWVHRDLRSFTRKAVVEPSSVVAPLVIDEAHSRLLIAHEDASWSSPGGWVWHSSFFFIVSLRACHPSDGTLAQGSLEAGTLLRMERVTGWRLWHSWMRPSIQGVSSFVCVLDMHLAGVHHDHEQDDQLLDKNVAHVVWINIPHAWLGTSRKLLLLMLQPLVGLSKVVKSEWVCLKGCWQVNLW